MLRSVQYDRSIQVAVPGLTSGTYSQSTVNSGSLIIQDYCVALLLTLRSIQYNQIGVQDL